MKKVVIGLNFLILLFCVGVLFKWEFLYEIYDADYMVAVLLVSTFINLITIITSYNWEF
jgi:hypothetical protein